jgi:hypothetical protein
MIMVKSIKMKTKLFLLLGVLFLFSYCNKNEIKKNQVPLLKKNLLFLSQISQF